MNKIQSTKLRAKTIKLMKTLRNTDETVCVLSREKERKTKCQSQNEKKKKSPESNTHTHTHNGKFGSLITRMIDVFAL